MSLTRDEAITSLERLESSLAREVELAQTRDQHIRAAGNLQDLRRIVGALRPEHAAP